MAHPGVGHLRAAGGGPVAQAVAVGAEERATLDYLAGALGGVARAIRQQVVAVDVHLVGAVAEDLPCLSSWTVVVAPAAARNVGSQSWCRMIAFHTTPTGVPSRVMTHWGQNGSYN